MVFVSNFQDNSVRFIVRIWTTPTLFPEVSGQLQIRIAKLLAENDIIAPVSQMNVHFVPTEARFPAIAEP